MTGWGALGRWVILGAATALGGGCSLLVGFPDRSLAPDESAGGAGGASTSTSAGGGAGGHGGATTTSTSAATSSVGSSASTGGASTYCDTIAPAPLFCDDFEKGSLSSTWAKVQSPTNGVLATSTAQAVQPPGHSLEARLDGGSTGDNHGYVSTSFPATYASMRLGFDLYIDQLPSSGIIFAAEIDLGGDLGALLYIASSGTVKLQQKTSPSTFGHDLDSMTDLPLHQWTRVELTLALGGTSTATLKLGAKVALDAVKLESEWAPGQPTVLLGDNILSNEDARAVYYDNVVFSAP